jgi:hypothetical protein
MAGIIPFRDFLSGATHAPQCGCSAVRVSTIISEVLRYRSGRHEKHFRLANFCLQGENFILSVANLILQVGKIILQAENKFLQVENFLFLPSKSGFDLG